MTTITEQKSEPRTLPEFRNEALTDFSRQWKRLWRK
jgi:hypothetical protein